MDLKKEKSHRK